MTVAKPLNTIKVSRSIILLENTDTFEQNALQPVRKNYPGRESTLQSNHIGRLNQLGIV